MRGHGKRSWLVKLKNFLGQLFKGSVLQAGAQGIGVIAGLLLVRELSKADYALFTVVLTSLASMRILADMGLLSGMTAIGSKVYDDSTKYRNLYRTVENLRAKTGLFSLLVMLPMIAYLLIQNGAAIGQTIMLMLIVSITFYIQFSNDLMINTLRLFLQGNRVIKIGLISSTVRLGVIGAFSFIFLDSYVATLTLTLVAVLEAQLLKKTVSTLPVKGGEEDSDYKSQIIGIMKRQAPNSLLYMFNAQIMLIVLALYGTSDATAEFGALGRLAMILAVITSVFTLLIAPKLARCHQRKTFLIRFHLFLLVFLVFIALIVVIAYVFPTQLLWILGPQYMHLHTAVVLMVLNASLSTMAGLMYQVNMDKGWILSPFLNIGLFLTGYVIFIPLLDLSSVNGVLLLSVLLAAVVIPVQYLYTILRSKKLRKGA
ncbi:putative Polysaccharide biosynthesis protein [uncultured Thiomicrorhabdus sp.]